VRNPLRSLLGILTESIRHRLFFLYGTYVLSRIGILIAPYYLTRESLQENINIRLSQKSGSITYGFLTRPEIEEIYHHPETRSYAMLEKEYQNDACHCFALKQNGEVMAFMWANFNRCHYEYSPFGLQNDEAYLFNAYTYRKFRGMDLAPYLRFKTYQALTEMGRPRLYSLTEYFNTPALNFKKKLNARHIRLSVYIKVFSIFKQNITIKKYPEQSG
jgi:hypothetical protein